MAALLVVDSSLNRRIAAELKARGRPAVSVGEVGLGRAGDGELLRGLARRFASDPWVLITADDWLPLEQAPLVGDLGVTLATVEWVAGGAPGREQLARETCHRWAHVMAAQTRGTARRYNPRSHRRWTERTD